MRYYLDLFSPDTWKAFNEAGRSVTGFGTKFDGRARAIAAGDRLICYLTKLSRWVGVLEVIEGPFLDRTPIFLAREDPFVVRFRVKPLVWLPLERAVPIYEKEVWERLSFTRGQGRRSRTWLGSLRASLLELAPEDGRFLEGLLREQERGGKVYPIEEARLKMLRIPRTTIEQSGARRAVLDLGASETVEDESRASTEMQALLASIGRRMGMSVWVPRADRVRVMQAGGGSIDQLLDRLPLNYDEQVLRTIEQIDVLWLKGRAIKRAFEVEHSTAVYSGLLRLADLLALQPNMEIKLHIVAPASRREKVWREINRPLFGLLEGRPLSRSCTFLSYESIRKLAEEPHLSHMADSVLDGFAESMGA